MSLLLRALALATIHRAACSVGRFWGIALGAIVCFGCPRGEFATEGSEFSYTGVG